MTDDRPIDESLVYVPSSALHLPKEAKPIRFVVIDAIPEKKSRIASIGCSRMARHFLMAR